MVIDLVGSKVNPYLQLIEPPVNKVLGKLDRKISQDFFLGWVLY